MRLYRELKQKNIWTVIAPTPRILSVCCGISLLIKKEDKEEVKRCIEDNQVEIIKIAEIKRDINPNRDRYC